MSGNAIRLDNGYIGGAVTLMENLERRVENLRKPRTYAEILSETRDGLKVTSPQLRFTSTIRRTSKRKLIGSGGLNYSRRNSRRNRNFLNTNSFCKRRATSPRRSRHSGGRKKA